MTDRRQDPSAQPAEPDTAVLAEYLQRHGFPREADLARAAGRHREDLVKLEAALAGRKAELPISPRLAEMEQLLRAIFGPSEDIVYRHLRWGPRSTRGLLVYINGMVDLRILQATVQGLTADLEPGAEVPVQPERAVKRLLERQVTTPGATLERRLAPLIQGVLAGNAALFVAGGTAGVQISAADGDHRSIEEPETERVIRGPREGFIEDLTTNVALIRRRLRDERLRLETLTIGRRTRTRVAILYLSGVCKNSLVDEARRRLARIDIDGIVDTGYIEEMTEDTPWTVFPLYKSTERPDTVTSGLLEGRLAILADGTPFALVAPTSFVDMMQAPEDYYERFPIVFMLRLLRWLFAAVALLGPSFYVAWTTFHQEMLPTSLLLSILSAREGVPFPAVVEALLMEVAFEALREAGVRLPRPVGQAISIVGALVIGDAAVRAGMVSAPMVIVVALTGIASFIIPRFSAAVALRMLRFPLLILAGSFGAFGITLGVLVILIHLLGLRSFGAPYLAPLGPWLPPDQKDVVLRAPHWANRTRPAGFETQNPVRAGKGLRPGPNRGKGGGR